VNPLRLVFVTPRFWPLADDPERALANLAAELVARGCRVTVLTAAWDPSWSTRITFRGVPVVRLPHPPRGGRQTFRYVRSVSRWLQSNRGRYDLVYVSTLRHEAYAAVRTLRCHAATRGVPVVLRPSTAGRFGDCLWQIDARCGRRIKRECMKAAAWVGSSRAIERELQAAGYPRTAIHLLPDGVRAAPPRDPAAMAAARAALIQANATLEMPAGTPMAVCIAPLRRDTALRHLISAWHTVVARWPNARLWLAGEGPDRRVLSHQIEALNLTGRVVLVGVFDELDVLLDAADLFVLPSLQGGTSLALLEAMAAGVPIVAGDVQGNRDAITDGRHGLLVPPGNVDALAATIVRLLQRPDLAAQLGVAARERAAAEFSLAKMANGHLTLFQSLIHPPLNSPDGSPVVEKVL